MKKALPIKKKSAAAGSQRRLPFSSYHTDRGPSLHAASAPSVTPAGQAAPDWPLVFLCRPLSPLCRPPHYCCRHRIPSGRRIPLPAAGREQITGTTVAKEGSESNQRFRVEALYVAGRQKVKVSHEKTKIKKIRAVEVKKLEPDILEYENFADVLP